MWYRVAVLLPFEAIHDWASEDDDDELEPEAIDEWTLVDAVVWSAVVEAIGLACSRVDEEKEGKDELRSGAKTGGDLIGRP